MVLDSGFKAGKLKEIVSGSGCAGVLGSRALLTSGDMKVGRTDV